MRCPLLAIAAMCGAPSPSPVGTPAPVPGPAPRSTSCTIARDQDLLAFLRTHDCVVAAGTVAAPADLEVKLVRGGQQFYDSISFLVMLANQGAAPMALDLRVRDQRLCFDGSGGGVPSHACELLATAPAGVEARVHVILAPKVAVHVEGLVFVRHTLYERATPHGNGWFERPMAPGSYDHVVSVPLAFAPSRGLELTTKVAIP